MDHDAGDPRYPKQPTQEEIDERVEQAIEAVVATWEVYWSPLAEALHERFGFDRREALMFLMAKESANLTNALNRYMNSTMTPEDAARREEMERLQMRALRRAVEEIEELENGEDWKQKHTGL